MKVNTANNPTKAIELIYHWEEITKTQHKRVIQYIYKQGEILKFFKETENFFDGSEQSWLTIYFKIAVYKILEKLTLPASYFPNNLKSVKLVFEK